MFVRFWRLGCRCYIQKFTNKTVSLSCTSKFCNYHFPYFVNMPPKRKANKPTEEAVDAGLKKKRIDKEEFDGEEGDDIDVKSTENIKPKRGAKATEQKPAPVIESKSRTKGKAPVAKSTKKDAVKSNLDDEESDSSVESKKDAPVKPTKKIEKKAPAPETKRKARGGNEGPSAKTTKHDKEVSPLIEEDEDDEVPASSAKSSKVAPKGKGRGAKATQSKAKVAKKNEDVAEVVPEEEPELSPIEEEPKKKPAATKGSKKMIPEIIEDEEMEPQDSSDDEFQKKATTAKATKKTAKKHQEEEVEPEDVSSDESKKKAPVSKRGKRNVKKDDIQKDESEPEDDAASGDSKKTAPAEKASKKEIIQEEGSESEDVSSDDSKKKVAVTKGVKKNVKKEAGATTASRGRSAKTTDKKEKLNPSETSYETLDFSCDQKNAAGDVYNLRIASWNIGGIKSWVKKDGLQYVLREKPDIFCIQETRCNAKNYPAEIEEIEGYKFYWHASSKEGYAGVSLWSRIEPIEVQYGIGNEEQDEDGRCITAEFEKYYIVSVYVPNSGRKLVNMAKRLEWNKLFKNFIKELDAKKPVIICGDLNVAHSEIDLANPKTNTKNAGFTPEEREGLTEFLNEGFIDTFRNINPDTTGAYTFWTYLHKSRSKNVGWRLDYFVTSNRLKDNLCDSLIRSSVLGSDHCPIVLFVNI